MPFYEHKCSNCGHELEELQSITAAPLVKCPECGKDTLQRLIGTGAGLIFKGSGFYLTDYKNNNSKSRGGGEKKPETKPLTGDKSKKEPAAKQSKESASETKGSSSKEAAETKSSAAGKSKKESGKN